MGVYLLSTQIRIDMKDKNGNSPYASYSTLCIGGFTTDYILHVSGYNGTAGDALAYHNLMKFSTKDNDQYSGGNCATYFTGAWWYRYCYLSNLNGRYGVNDNRGIAWYSWNGWSLQYVEMKICRV